jgi:thiamine transport system permease protein
LATRGERDLLNLTVAQAATNSLRNALIAAAISMTIGTLVAYLLSRPKGTKMAHLSNRALDTLFLLPMGVSSVVLGFGYLISFGGGPLPLRSSWLIVPLVQALMATPLVIRLIYPALISIGSEQREAAATDGASAAQTWWLIETPMIRGVIATAAGFALVVSIGEFGAASLLAYGDQATLPTILYALISRPGPVNYGMAMAVCALLILLTLILVLAVSFRGSNRTQRQP